jgi:imidazolonepropionase
MGYWKTYSFKAEMMTIATPNTPLDLRIDNVHILTMDKSIAAPYGLLEHYAVGIADGKIVWLGDGTTATAIKAHQVIDGKGQFLSPGLIDCHNHLVFAGSRAHEFEQRLNGVSYAEIARQGGGILATVKATRAATEDELFELACGRARALIKEGVTTIEVKSGYGLDLQTESKMLRVARKLGQTLPCHVQTSFLGAHALPPEYKDNADAYIDWICTEVLPAIAEQGLADAVDGFCEGIGFTPQQIQRVFNKAQELNLPVKLHAEQLSDLGGATLVADYHGLSADHLEYLSAAGIAAMAQSTTVAVLLPGAFYTLSETKLPPIADLRSAGVDLAIGSDYNPGSSPICSLKLMLHMACTLFKLTPEEALAGVTRNAAKALGLDNKGTIQIGQDADLCLWNISHPAELAYTYGVNPLTAVWQAGEESKFN